jgi:hypothetical protein
MRSVPSPKTAEGGPTERAYLIGIALWLATQNCRRGAGMRAIELTANNHLPTSS